jgi:hypothetical protein
LHWNTVTEVNNSGFDIERCIINPQSAISNLPAETHGVQAGSQFSKVGFVSGSGTSAGPKQYSFIDHNLAAGLYSYRLKQIDRSGAFKYTQEVQVDVGTAPKAFTLGQNYPNPFNPSTTLEFTFERNGKATVKIFNILGQEVATVFNQEVEAGRIYQAQFNASHFTSGVYMSVLESGGKRLFRKMLLVK